MCGAFPLVATILAVGLSVAASSALPLWLYWRSEKENAWLRWQLELRPEDMKKTWVFPWPKR